MSVRHFLFSHYLFVFVATLLLFATACSLKRPILLIQIREGGLYQEVVCIPAFRSNSRRCARYRRHMLEQKAASSLKKSGPSPSLNPSRKVGRDVKAEDLSRGSEGERSCRRARNGGVLPLRRPATSPSCSSEALPDSQSNGVERRRGLLNAMRIFGR